MKLSILPLSPRKVFKNCHHIHHFPLLRYHRGSKHGLRTARSSSAILFFSSFKTLGQMPLLTASCYCLLCQCWTAFSTAASISDMFIGEPHPAEEWVLPRWSRHSTLKTVAEISAMALSLLHTPLIAWSPVCPSEHLADSWYVSRKI